MNDFDHVPTYDIMSVSNHLKETSRVSLRQDTITVRLAHVLSALDQIKQAYT
jgi:hypothetical protein